MSPHPDGERPPGPPGDRPSAEHRRPPGVDDATVEALGKLSEALEAVEVGRGHLYAFHKQAGTADGQLGEAVSLLREAGHHELAELLDEQLVGHNVIAGRWTFQLVEEYDDTYWSLFRSLEARARDQLAGGRRHLFEAEMKEDERSPGRVGHEAAPDDGSSQAAT